jgi:hypothetical protein
MKTSEAICLALLAAMAGWHGKQMYDERYAKKPDVCPKCDCKYPMDKLQGLNNGFLNRRL